MDPSRIQVEFRRGTRLPEADLWLDPWEGREFAFVSHAHADHVAPHTTMLCSTVTAAFLTKRFRPKGTIIALEFGEPWERNGFRFRLYPAGHILGSAQVHAERIADGATLLYTGDFKLRPGTASEPPQAVPARTLIMETTYGLPRYVFPPSESVLDRIAVFAREHVEDGRVPMFAAYSLGKAQELLCALGQRVPGLSFVLHDSAARMTTIYEEMGYVMPPWEVLGPNTDLAGKAVIAPPSALRSQQLRKVKQRATAMISGWGLNPSARFQYQVDEVFPLSDHAGYDDLIRYVELVDPAVVLTLHGFADEFARDLRARGREAWSLTGHNQLELFGASPASPSLPEPGAAPDGGSGEFATMAGVNDAVRGAAGRTAKITLLARYLRTLDDEELPLACVFLSARPFARTEEVRTLQTGWAVVRRALGLASGLSEAEIRQLGVGQNDGPRVTQLVLEGRVQPGPWRLTEVRALFDRLAETRGPLAKAQVLAEAFRHMTPREGALLTGILGGELRTGVQEGMLEEALAQALDLPGTDIRQARMLTGDLGETARRARGGLESLRATGITPLVPVTCMLASPSDSADEIWERLGSAGSVWIEDKFDGIRAQLHKIGDRVEIFSRDLRPLHAEFAELLEPARRLPADVILDGEIVAYAEGKRLTFQDLQKRLGRKRDADLFFGPEIPVRFVAFDLLWHDGETLLARPLEERRSRLDALSLAEPFEPLAVLRAASGEAIEEAFRLARKRGNEGLIAKDAASAYTPGRRGMSWLKLKKAMTTLDCVVVRAEEGHGKRSHVLSDYTFAVRDEATGRLAILGKAYSGLSDAEIEELTAHFLERTLSKNRRVREVIPDIVLEIAFDSIRASTRHDSGLALRFPRIKAIRRDKSVAEIDTLAEAKRLAGLP